MAIPIKAIPTLYGEEATRIRKIIDETEKNFENSPVRDITHDPRYTAMKEIVEKSEKFRFLFQ